MNLDPEIASAASTPKKALAMLSRHLGKTVIRECLRGIWKLQDFNGRPVYFAATYTHEVCILLASEKRAVCVYGKVYPSLTPGAEATRTRAFTQLVVRNEQTGEIELDPDVLSDLIPPRTAKLYRDMKGSGLLSRLMDWEMMLEWWCKQLREALKRGDKVKCRPPSMKTIAYEWFEKRASRATRNAKPSVRTLKRDLRELRHPSKGSVAERLGVSFAYLWSQCYDVNFVRNDSQRTLSEVVAKAFAINGKPPPDMLPPTDAYGRPAYRSAS